MCGTQESLPENPSYKWEWVEEVFFPSSFLFLSLPNIWSVKLARPPGCRYCCQSHRVMTLVCKSRGILSLDKHLALSAAVTSWNGSWHKVAPGAKNILWRYVAERGPDAEKRILLWELSSFSASDTQRFVYHSVKHLQAWPSEHLYSMCLLVWVAISLM